MSFSGTVAGGIEGAIGGAAMGPLGAVGGAIVGGAASLIGGEQANKANSAQAANANYLGAMELAESQQYNDKAVANAQAYNTAAVGQAQGFAAQMQQKQMDYETNMSNTAYQRAVSGMKAAGLNPILSAGTGGASTPSVSSPSVSPLGSPILGSPSPPGGRTAEMQNTIGPAFSSAMQGAKLMGDLRLQGAQVDTANTQASTAEETRRRAQADANTAERGERQAIEQINLTQAQTATQIALADKTRREAAAIEVGGEAGSPFSTLWNPMKWAFEGGQAAGKSYFGTDKSVWDNLSPNGGVPVSPPNGGRVIPYGSTIDSSGRTVAIPNARLNVMPASMY